MFVGREENRVSIGKYLRNRNTNDNIAENEVTRKRWRERVRKREGTGTIIGQTV